MPGETGLLFPDERRPPGLRYEPAIVSRADRALTRRAPAREKGGA